MERAILHTVSGQYPLVRLAQLSCQTPSRAEQVHHYLPFGSRPPVGYHRGMVLDLGQWQEL